jgi:hypothetical protein
MIKLTIYLSIDRSQSANFVDSITDVCRVDFLKSVAESENSSMGANYDIEEDTLYLTPNEARVIIGDLQRQLCDLENKK